eukprot:CFRG5345T1
MVVAKKHDIVEALGGIDMADTVPSKFALKLPNLMTGVNLATALPILIHPHLFGLVVRPWYKSQRNDRNQWESHHLLEVRTPKYLPVRPLPMSDVRRTILSEHFDAAVYDSSEKNKCVALGRMSHPAAQGNCSNSIHTSGCCSTVGNTKNAICIQSTCEGETILLFHWKGEWMVSRGEAGIQSTVCDDPNKIMVVSEIDFRIALLGLCKDYCYVFKYNENSLTREQRGRSDNEHRQNLDIDIVHVATRDMCKQQMLVSHHIGIPQPAPYTITSNLNQIISTGAGVCVMDMEGYTVRIPSIAERIQHYIHAREQSHDYVGIVVLRWLVQGIEDICPDLVNVTERTTEALPLPFGAEALQKVFSSLDGVLAVCNTVLDNPLTRNMSAYELTKHQELRSQPVVVHRLVSKLASWRGCDHHRAHVDTDTDALIHTSTDSSKENHFTKAFLCKLLLGGISKLNINSTCPYTEDSHSPDASVHSTPTSIYTPTSASIPTIENGNATSGLCTHTRTQNNSTNSTKVTITIADAALLLEDTIYDARVPYDLEPYLTSHVTNMLAISDTHTKRIKAPAQQVPLETRLPVQCMPVEMEPILNACYSAAGVLLVRNFNETTRGNRTIVQHTDQAAPNLEILTLSESRKGKQEPKAHLPGGKRESFESASVETAGREMWEETGGSYMYTPSPTDQYPHSQLVRLIRRTAVQMVWIHSGRYVMYICQLEKGSPEDCQLFDSIETSFIDIPAKNRHPDAKTVSLKWMRREEIVDSAKFSKFFQKIVNNEDITKMLTDLQAGVSYQ